MRQRFAVLVRVVYGPWQSCLLLLIQTKSTLVTNVPTSTLLNVHLRSAWLHTSCLTVVDVVNGAAESTQSHQHQNCPSTAYQGRQATIELANCLPEGLIVTTAGVQRGEISTVLAHP